MVTYNVKLIDGTQFIGKRGLKELLKDGTSSWCYQIIASKDLPVGGTVRVSAHSIVYVLSEKNK